MKGCPNCGFIPTLTNRAKLALFQRHFPDVPVMEMHKRQWISLDRWTVGGQLEWSEADIPALLDHVLAELMRFCGVETVDDLKLILGWEGDLMDAAV